MLKINIKPISKWIGAETKSPKRSQFKSTYKKTKELLENELWQFTVVWSSVQLEMFIHAEDLRQDGELRANAKPYKPGVALSFTIITRRLRNRETGEIRNETKTLSYPCDTFDDWRDNLRAIALSLEKLRAVSRYGVFKYEDMIERLALPSADGKLATIDLAYQFLAEHSGENISKMQTDTAVLNQAYLTCLHKFHPDKGGDKELFLRLQEFRQILGIR